MMRAGLLANYKHSKKISKGNSCTENLTPNKQKYIYDDKSCKEMVGCRLPVAERRGYSNVFNALVRISREEGLFTLWRVCEEYGRQNEV